MSAKEEVLNDLEKIVEETTELAGEVYQWSCDLSRKQHAAQLLIVGAAAGAIGGTVAYFAGKRVLKTKYEKIAAKEISEAKKFYSTLRKKGEFETPEKAVSSLITKPEADRAISKYKGGIEEHSKKETDFNIFSKQEEELDDEVEEELSRDSENPYIISEEEYLQGELDFAQTQLTFYEGDMTLADENDKEIPHLDPIVGEANITRFGHRSNNENVVYIRNEKLSTDFEVVRSELKYAVAVLGLQHSDGYGFEKFRKSRGGD